MKDKNPLVSIVVPVYNTQQYIDNCVQSLLQQTYQNIEIILIDDGSTDESLKRCRELSKTYDNIRVYHTENGGLSSARNVGISKSRGEYISFVDSDDLISSNMIDRLVNGCIKNDAEIGYCNIVRKNAYNKAKKELVISSSEKITNRDALALLLLSDTSSCNKVYKRSLFNKISFPKGKLYEDIYTTPKLLNKCNGVYIDAESFYYYIQRDNSIIHAKFSPEKMEYLYASKWLYDFICKEQPLLKQEAERFRILAIITLISDIYPQKKKFNKEYREAISQLKLFSNTYMKNQYISKSKKIMIFLSLHHLVWAVNLIKSLRQKVIYRQSIS